MKFLKKFATRAEYEAYMADNMENYPHVGYIADEGAVEYVKEAPPMQDKMPLHFEAIEDMTVSFSTNAIEYSLDNKTWQTLPAATATPVIEAGRRVFFRANGLTATSADGIGTFSTTGEYNVAGNVLSMLYGDNFKGSVDITLPNYAFRKLFAFSSNLRDASKLILPSTKLSHLCYNGTFYQSGITAAPELRADEMAQECCKSMFQDCANLQIAPALPATTLASGCYQAMFAGSGIKSIVLPATTLASGCYKEMCQRCTALSYVKMMAIEWSPAGDSSEWMKSMTVSNGTFVKNAAATWSNTFGISAIPTGWNVETATE